MTSSNPSMLSLSDLIMMIQTAAGVNESTTCLSSSVIYLSVLTGVVDVLVYYRNGSPLMIQ